VETGKKKKETKELKEKKVRQKKKLKDDNFPGTELGGGRKGPLNGNREESSICQRTGRKFSIGSEGRGQMLGRD